MLVFLSAILITHHHHDHCCGHVHKPQKILIGDGIHNIADGLVLAASFAVSPLAGAGVFFSILIHEFLQESSEFFVLKAAGFVEDERKGYWTYYSLNRDALEICRERLNRVCTCGCSESTRKVTRIRRGGKK